MISRAALATAKTLLHWWVVIGVFKVRVSGTAWHFKNRALKLEVETLGATNGALERMTRSRVYTLKAHLNGRRALFGRLGGGDTGRAVGAQCRIS